MNLWAIKLAEPLGTVVFFWGPPTVGVFLFPNNAPGMTCLGSLLGQFKEISSRIRAADKLDLLLIPSGSPLRCANSSASVLRGHSRRIK